VSGLLELAEDVVRQALAKGATDAECTVTAGEEFSVNVRMREIEQLKESGSRAMGLRVFVGQRNGSATTSDLTGEGVARMIRAALDNAAVTTDDPHAGLADATEFGFYDGDLQLFSPEIPELTAPWKIEQAMAAERSALEADPRIRNSEGGSFDSYQSERYFANSRGFRGSYRTTSAAMSAVPVAEADGRKERDYAYTIARSLNRLKDASAVGREAAERTLRRLGARKIATQKAPVLFESRVARSLVGHIFEAVSGDSIYRKASFLLDKLGEKVASDKLTVIDDPTIPGLFGSWPFDDEGVPARRKVVIERGVLATYLHNSYSARKCGTRTTGNAGRGLAGNPWVEHGNFYVEAGEDPPEKLIAGIRRGLLVTELMGQGVNIVNGDYSRGAAGLWIENGEIAYPVSEITIAGNLREMLHGIVAAGADLEFQGSTASPALLIEEMTISGS
jgi:PmbA protein